MTCLLFLPISLVLGGILWQKMHQVEHHYKFLLQVVEKDGKLEDHLWQLYWVFFREDTEENMFCRRFLHFVGEENIPQIVTEG